MERYLTVEFSASAATLGALRTAREHVRVPDCTRDDYVRGSHTYRHAWRAAAAPHDTPLFIEIVVGFAVKMYTVCRWTLVLGTGCGSGYDTIRHARRRDVYHLNYVVPPPSFPLSSLPASSRPNDAGWPVVQLFRGT